MDERATAFCSSRRRGQAALDAPTLARCASPGCGLQETDPDPASLIINGPQP